MRRSVYLLFPLAALFNSFSMTALLLAFGLAGRTEVAADIALVQGASLALFFAFSANGRNVVLAAGGDSAQRAASSLMLTRLALLAPLALATYFLSVGVGGAMAGLTVVLIARRACEWVGEIALARHEVLGNTRVASRAVAAEGVSLVVCLAGSLLVGYDLRLSALPWAIVPLISFRGARLSPGSQHLGLKALLPHFGSSGIIGASVFVFRLSVTLLAGKALAGTLFTAFAVGSLVPTVFGQALAPTLIRRFGNNRLPYPFAIAQVGMFIVGCLIAASSVWLPSTLSGVTQPPIFWLATGLSVAGGAIMTFATLLRTRILHEGEGQDVFGPDLLANVLIATCVPFVFYVCGVQCLSALYLLSAFFNLAFLIGAKSRRSVVDEHRKSFLVAISTLLILPVFFQIDGGLFSDTAFVFDAQGDITKLPLPISVATTFLGIAILGNYWQVSRTLTALFFSSLLFVFTSLIAAEGGAYQEGAKLLLLAQFLLPMFGLVLGEMYGTADRRGRFLQWSACGVLILILPAQLIASWIHGYTVLSPKVFFFSIYQHLQYFPMVVSALTIVIAVSLWDKTLVERRAVWALFPISAIYLISSQSMAAVVGFFVAVSGFGFIYLQRNAGRRQALLLLVAVVSLFVIFGAATESGWLAKQLVPDGRAGDQQSWQVKYSKLSGHSAAVMPQGVGERIEHWRFFSDGIVDSLRTFLAGHAVPPAREQHPSAHNFWLDTAYNFGVISLVPLVGMLAWTVHAVWVGRRRLMNDSEIFGLALAVLYLLLFENMLKVGMRQPYPGILTYFLWGLLVARLWFNSKNSVAMESASA